MYDQDTDDTSAPDISAEDTESSIGPADILTPEGTFRNAPEADEVTPSSINGKQEDSSYLFNADAQAVLANAPTLETGIDALQEAYNAKSWDDPKAARDTLSKYGQYIRYRFEDKSQYSPSDLGHVLPPALRFNPDAGQGDDQVAKNLDATDKWEKGIKDFLDQTDNAQYLTTKHKILNSVEKTATEMRRVARYEDKNALLGSFEDFGLRVAGAALSPLKLFGIESPSKAIEERTSPQYDDDFGSTIAGGVGMLGGTFASGVAGPPGAYAYLGATGLSALRARYKQSLEVTGDKDKALYATLVEVPAQAVMLLPAGKIVGGVAGNVWKKVLGKELTPAAEGLLSRVLKPAVTQGAAFATGGAISKEAESIGTDTEFNYTPGEAAKNFAAGLLFGGVSGLADVSVNPRVKVDPAVEGGGQPPPLEKVTVGSVSDKVVEAKTEAPEENPSLINDPPPADSRPKSTFQTEDGSTYTMNQDGLVGRKDSEGQTYQPMDHTGFVDEDTASVLGLTRALSDGHGENPKLTTDGQRLFVKANGKWHPVEEVAPGTPGSYPVSANLPKIAEDGSLEYRSFVGKKITASSPATVPEIKPPAQGEKQSIGAMSIHETRERGLSERVRQAENVDEEIRNQFGDSELGLDRYFQVSHTETKDAAGNVIASKGIPEATRDFLNLPDSEDLATHVAAAADLVERYQNASRDAYARGNEAAGQALADKAAEVYYKAARLGTGYGRGIDAYKIFNLNPRTRAAAIRGSLRQEAIESVAREEGLSVKDLQDTKVREKETAKKIEELIKTGEEAKKADPEAKPERKPEDYLNEKQKKSLKDLTEKQKKEKAINDKLKERTAKIQEKLTPAEEEKFVRIAEKAKKLPEGSNRRKQLEDILKETELEKTGKALSGQRKGSLLFSYFMNNAISGAAIAAKSAGDFWQNFNATVGLAAGGRPDLAVQFLKGSIKAIPEATRLGINAFFTGKSSAVPPEIQKADLVSRTELPYIRHLGWLTRPFPALSEAMAHVDREGMAAALAYRGAKEKGLSGKALEDYVMENLHNAKEEHAGALKEAKALAESLKEDGVKWTDKDIKSVAWDIVRNKRPEAIRDESQRFASFNTFSNTSPYGYMGVVCRAIQAASGTALFKIAGCEVNPQKYVILFTNMAGNIVNAGLDLTPVGLMRSFETIERVGSGSSVRGEMRTKDPIQQTIERGHFIEGAAIAGGMAALGWAYRKDKDPFFAVYGEGGKTQRERALFRQMGGQPFSVKVGGVYIHSSHTPFQFIIGPLGNFFDAARFDPEFDQKSVWEKLGYAAFGAIGALADYPFMQGFGNILDIARNSQDIGAAEKVASMFERQLMSTAKTFVPASGFLHMWSKLIDNPVDTKLGYWANFISGTPVVERIGTKPALNAFGEPIDTRQTLTSRMPYISRIVGTQTSDPDFLWLGQNGYTIPTLSLGGVSTGLHSDRTVQERIKEYGPSAADYLTPDEKNQLIKKAGPKIRSIVSAYRERYGNSAHRDFVQDRLNAEVNRVLDNTKKSLWLK